MKVEEVISNRILELLEAGTVPWHKPWANRHTRSDAFPRNAISKRHYRGINVFILASQSYGSHYWLTYKEALALGGHVKAGEHGSPIVFWKWLSREIEKPEACEAIYANMLSRPGLEHGATLAITRGRKLEAYYSPSTDRVVMPRREAFDSPEFYYSVLFHELTHSTGASHRLNRPTLNQAVRFGDSNYSKEELVAEMGASFLAGHTGIEQVTLRNSAAYLDSWIRALKGDAKLVILAAAAAQKATDYILSRQAESAQETACALAA